MIVACQGRTPPRSDEYFTITDQGSGVDSRDSEDWCELATESAGSGSKHFTGFNDMVAIKPKPTS